MDPGTWKSDAPLARTTGSDGAFAFGAGFFFVVAFGLGFFVFDALGEGEAETLGEGIAGRGIRVGEADSRGRAESFERPSPVVIVPATVATVTTEDATTTIAALA
ncbi:hypothetical protein [Streptomyces sp. NPDC060194]|uniref:hypothetical protein n=1 Tax=Streptomyces sp. NPDC060194 TaxID=3347069 RepID=UPI0036598D02